MKRKVRKFNEGGKTYDKEDEGLFGGKVKYREEDGRKYVAGNANPFDRNPQEQRYYSMGDVKGKLSGLFGGKKEEAKSESSKEEGTNRFTAAKDNTPDPEKGIAAGFKSSESKYERNDNEKSMPDVKKAAPRQAASKSKIEAAAPAPKKAKAEEVKKPTPLPGKAEDDKPSKYEDDKSKIGSQGSFKFDSKPVARTRAGTVVKSSDEPSALDKAAANEKYVARLKKQNEENEARKERIKSFFSSKSPNRSYKSGGSVKSSASSRGDGCAVRGKTKGRIY